LLTMTKENLELFKAKRKRVMRLGMTEEEYNDMIASAVTWIGKTIAVYDQDLYSIALETYTMRLIIGDSVASAMNRLQYYSRLLRDELWDTDDPLEFYKEQWRLLNVLKVDWQRAHGKEIN